MLAPRKTLWSTPSSAVDHLVEKIPLQPNDCVLDIGCGDGRILLQWAERATTKMSKVDDNGNSPTPQQANSLSFLGIDIDPDRIDECRRSCQQAKDEGRIHPKIRIEFTCANALESVDHFQNATVIFLYLIPRGLNLIYPLLREHVQKMHAKKPNKTIRVATYMSKLPMRQAGAPPPICRATCRVEHQPDAAWPLYFYEFKSNNGNNENNGNGT